MVSTALRAEGFSAVNLGPNLPVDALMDEAKKVKPIIVWYSVSHLKKAHILRTETSFSARVEMNETDQRCVTVLDAACTPAAMLQGL